MDQMTVSKFWHNTLKMFLVIGTMFYIPVQKGVDALAAQEQGYMVQELFFRYGIGVLYLISMSLVPKRVFSVKSIILFAVFVFLTSVCSGFDVYSRAKMLNLLFGIILFKMVFEHIDFSFIPSFGYCFGWLMVANLILMCLQVSGHDPIVSQIGSIPEARIQMVVGFMRLKVHLGVLAALLSDRKSVV